MFGLMLTGFTESIVTIFCPLYLQLSGSKLKRLVPFEAGTHNDTCVCPGYYESIAQFVYQVEFCLR